MLSREYLSILMTMADAIDVAVHVVTAEGTTIVYNEEMAKLEKISVNDVLGKPFRETFKHIPKSESTLYRALKYNKPTMKREQTYRNIYGKEVTTVNTTVPVTVDGQVIAAIEIAQDISQLKNMSDTILDLQNDIVAVASADNPDKKHKKTILEIPKYTFDDLIGESKVFEEVVKRAQKAAKNNVSVLLYGETGVGKELFAQSIHYAGRRKDKPFLAQNCAAIPESLLEGALFGTTKGGFTGAIDRAGLFEQASGGTLLLDEISAMPFELQGKLLRVLQEEYIRRVGGEKDIPVDVRIIATINEPAEQLIARGALRKDLFFRLGIVNITIPPLRERKDDIPILAMEFVIKYNKKYDKDIWMFSDKAMDKLRSYDYPGNVRELENIIMSAVAMTDNEHMLDEDDILIHSEYKSAPVSNLAEYISGNTKLSDYLEEIEKSVIKQYLVANEGNVSRTAKDLGMLRQNLQHKMKKYDL